MWHAQFLVHGGHYTQKKILGWQATENLDEFSLLLQKWAAQSPLQRGLSALDERRRDAGTINVFPAAPSSMKVTLIPVTPFQQNSSLLVCEATGRAAVVDPGGDLDVIQGEIARQNVTVEKVFLTHGHIDHCAGAKTLATHYGVPIEGPHPDESFWLDKLPDQSTRFGFPAAEAFEPDRWLQDGETVQFGDETLEVYHCPGHTPGHVVFFSRAHRLALVGDVLFAGSIGRTDFPRGNHADLVHAIREKLWPLGDDVTFVPGHGPTSTFGAERRTNPYVADGVKA
ncbi:Glyoxylase, beta-lactamase superfamily II [Paraburkholderia aspalathi]|uniref:Glyoxylase, beta-lactamase superfamily II n=2 Tax=Burkholderiaceae TaxID=119060 RepID=A0A1I7EMX0_9BURK|nr:Glyoxylase, beta-lactamase superfamily II [Paraburkholderia aspalathi]